MTATIAQPTGAPTGGPVGGHAVDERSLRIPDIGADLLPIEITASRRTRKVRRTVIVLVAAFAALLAAWYGLSVYETAAATDNLGRAQDNVQSLTRQQRGFNELVEVQTEAKTINEQLSTVMAKDLQWSKLLQSLQAAAPSGITITNVTAALLSDAAANAKPANQASDTVGTLTLGGVGPTKTVIAAYVDALGRVTGIANALPGDVNQQQQQAGLQFSIHMDITKAALGGRFTKVVKR